MVRYLAGLCVLVFLVGCHSQNQQRGKIPTLDGQVLSLSRLQRPWLLVNYWAPWCEPCRQEIQALNRFAETHPDVYLLGVNFDGGSQSALASQAKAYHIHYLHASADPSVALGIGDIPGLPVTYVFNQSAQLIKTLYGPQTEASLSKALYMNQKSK